MERIKLLWDFRGPNAEPIAKHHAVHLNEFVDAEGLQNTVCETQKMTEMYWITYLVVEKIHMNDLRERLKPNRGQLYTE